CGSRGSTSRTRRDLRVGRTERSICPLRHLLVIAQHLGPLRNHRDHVTNRVISQCHTFHVIVDSYRFLPRSFRPLYEGRGPFPGEVSPVWAPFEKRLSASRIALLTSAGVYMKQGQQAFDLEREDANPEWGDPTWRVIPATAKP